MTTSSKPRLLPRSFAPILVSVVVVVALLVSLAGVATAAGAVKPGVGDYEARPLQITGNYTLGAFAVTNDGGKRRIVSSEVLPGIFYPDLGKCDSFDVPLATESIPISKSGRFSMRENTPVRKGSLEVVWKGEWSKPKKVAGTLKIGYKKCSSKIHWAAALTPPA